MGSNSAPEYDYIIAGGGHCGCVIAARLAEDQNISVLVIEAGSSKDSVPASNVPAAVAQIFGSENDWKIENQPLATLNGRTPHLTRAKFIGGCSGSNGALCIRGSVEEYDDWQIEGWSGKEVHHYMSKAESFHTKPWFKPDEKAHGYSGPIVTAPHDNAPISDLVMESFQSKGLPLVHDMFTGGEVATGCGHAVRSINNGLRTTAADYIQGDNVKANITVLTQNYVDSIITERVDESLKATGIQFVRRPADTGTEIKEIIKARREIIICGGAFGSPAILLRSGIGPRSEIEKHGIKPVLELPGVGKNLGDHLIHTIYYELDAGSQQLTLDNQLWPPGAAEKAFGQWQNDHTGVMSQIPFGAFACTRLDERLKDSDMWRDAVQARAGRDPMDTTPKQPHVLAWNTECYFPTYLWPDIPSGGQQVFSLIVELFSARSLGSVTLAGADPTLNPIVDHNYLADPLDMLVFSEGCNFANEIVTQGTGTKDLIKGSWPPHAKHASFTRREQWEDEIRKGADTCYHPGGTCKMGNDDDSMAVLDPELRVRGIEGLRVADASILPKLPSGHLQMVVYAIGEKCADLIKKSAVTVSATA